MKTQSQARKSLCAAIIGNILHHMHTITNYQQYCTTA